MGVLRRQRALPVVLFADVRARAVETVCPAVESAHERLAWPGRARSWRPSGCRPAGGRGACRRCGAPRISSRSGAHDDDRVVEDVVGEVAADLRDLLDAADLLPYLAPQLVALGAGVLLRDVGFDADGHRLRELLGRSRIELAFGVGHTRSFMPTDRCAEGFVLEEQRGVVGAEMSPFEVEAAVDQQGLAGDVARQVGQQEQDRAGLLLRRAAPSHRDRLCGRGRGLRRRRCVTPPSRSRPARRR